MKISIVIFLILTSNFIFSQNENKIPTNLDEAINFLEVSTDSITKSKIINETEDNFVANSHFGLGMSIRNSWGLWKENDLVRYFNELGIGHPDDMSGIILTFFYRHLKGVKIDLEKQVKFYKTYWETQKWKQQEYQTKLDLRKKYVDTTQAEIELIRKIEQINDTIFEIKIEFHTGNINGACIISDYIEESYKVKIITTSDGIFSRGYNKIEFRWKVLPLKELLNIEYLVTCDNCKDELNELIGLAVFFVNNEKRQKYVNNEK